jgi:hypothetical protein
MKYIILISVLFVFTIGCANKKDEKKDTPTLKQKDTPVSNPGEKDTKTNEKKYECKHDQDCTLSTKVKGNCCFNCREKKAVHKDSVQDIINFNKKKCIHGKVNCPKVKCLQKKIPGFASCEQNKCVIKIAKPAGVVINKKGEYKFTAKLPERYACKTKDDCVATRLRPDHCCKTPCPSSKVAGNNVWFKAFKAQWKTDCVEWLKNNKYACPRPKCYPGGRPEKDCVKGKCVVNYKIIK